MNPLTAPKQERFVATPSTFVVKKLATVQTRPAHARAIRTFR